ncbi:hypothetical protein PMIT1327_02128 [Prochlorococcus marinus str. MIT 1327]|nr:hypothetical protein PMIT1312_01801 [Prochlorococcus marinus str. MIT 1312]KZR78923.1 hypothetical protein PMIT1327_02128 [Prochlorococcus marinus str. MIT 1327]
MQYVVVVQREAIAVRRAKILIKLLVLITISYSIYSACWIWIWRDLIAHHCKVCIY